MLVNTRRILALGMQPEADVLSCARFFRWCLFVLFEGVAVMESLAPTFVLAVVMAVGALLLNVSTFVGADGRWVIVETYTSQQMSMEACLSGVRSFRT